MLGKTQTSPVTSHRRPSDIWVRLTPLRKASTENSTTKHQTPTVKLEPARSDPPLNRLNYVTFNQDFSSLAIGTKNGYRIYSCDPFGKISEEKDMDIGIIEMLFSTSLIAVILSSRRLQITNTKRHSTICELTYQHAVLAVKMNRKRLVVVLETQIYLYDISNMKLLQTIETSPNPNAICALSPSSDKCYMVFPRPTPPEMTSFSTPSHAPPGASHVPSATGDILIYDALKGEAVTILEAHKSPLSAVTINNEGTLLATASDKGTIIRVFSIPGAQKLYQFRRGTYPARIYSMNFNLVSTLLCVSSATETVHIFRVGNFPAAQHAERPSLQSASSSRSSTSMGRSRSQSSDISSIYSDSTIMNAPPSFLNSQQQEKPHNERGYGIGSMFRRSSQSLGKTMVGAVGGYLPSAVTEMWEPARHFASVKLPESGIKSVVALSSTSPRVMVVTSEGLFYMYNIDMENGGECVLMKQYSLLDASEKMGQSLMWE